MKTTKTMKNQKGFTLIELILTISILGLLAVSVAPAFSNITQNSAKIGGQGTAAAVQSAINTNYGENLLNNAVQATGTFWPIALDASSLGACSTSNPCFDVVAQPVTTSHWTKTTKYEYQYQTGGVTQVYTYDPMTGTFLCKSGSCS